MQIGIPTHISFSPIAPHDYAVTSSTRVRPLISLAPFVSLFHNARVDCYVMKRAMFLKVYISQRGCNRPHWPCSAAPVGGPRTPTIPWIQATDTVLLQVLIHDGKSHSLKKTISRFPDTAYNANIRSDGQLFVAGCENGQVLIFTLSSRAILRKFSHHKRPTHATIFAPNKTQVISGSDDATLRLWDLSSGQQISMWTGHTDYVRSAACVSENAILSGSYDHTVRLWDTRAKGAQATLDHGCAVESVAQFQHSRLAASTGGTTVKLWDLTAGRVMQTLGNHQKTVTCASIVDVRDRDGAHCTRLLTGALDGHVKVYDLETFKVAYAYKYPSGVMSVAVAPDLSSMVVGMADRSMVVRKHKLGDGAISAIRANRSPPGAALLCCSSHVLCRHEASFALWCQYATESRSRRLQWWLHLAGQYSPRMLQLHVHISSLLYGVELHKGARACREW